MSDKTKTYEKFVSKACPERNRRVFIRTFGCQMNKYDSEIIRSVLFKEGYQFTDRWQQADVLLVNTCSVRQHAEDRVYSYLGRWGKYKKKNPNLIIGVCGCMAQKEGINLIKRMPYINLVCGTYKIPKIGELVKDLLENDRRKIETSRDVNNFPAPFYEVKENKVSSWVAIMRGCENYCSYCVVPYLRGKEVSRPLKEIEKEIRELADKGVKEVTLLGQNVNSYRIQNMENRNAFAHLLEEINNIERIERIRFMTSHPKDISFATIEAVRDLPKVCKHIHLPLQSGSDKILKLMNRNYTSIYYRELVNRIRENIPEVSITTDIIVGFPQETEEDFMDTYTLVKEIRFDAFFLFKYSPRPQTKAAEFEDNVPEKVKEKRFNMLLSLQKGVSQKINEGLIGRKLEILVEGHDSKSPKKLFGKTSTFKSISFNGEENMIGNLVDVEITNSTAGLLEGKIAPQK